MKLMRLLVPDQLSGLRGCSALMILNSRGGFCLPMHFIHIKLRKEKMMLS